MGARIERAREAAGLNKNQLARAIGTSWQHVDHWERDRTAPNTASLSRLASVLGVSIGSLLGAPEGGALGAGEPSPALETFLRAYAPPDLTASELAWLRAAPIDAALATPGQYVDLLHRLRTPAEPAHVPGSSAPGSQPPRARTQPPAARTGKRAKVRLEDVTALERRRKERRGA